MLKRLSLARTSHWVSTTDVKSRRHPALRTTAAGVSALATMRRRYPQIPELRGLKGLIPETKFSKQRFSL